MHPDTVKYNEALGPEDRALCDLLGKEIDKGLPEAENKVWHAHPVWFLDGNPVVGYSKLKGGVRLLFWSGQSFEEEGLAEGRQLQGGRGELHRQRPGRQEGPEALAGEGPGHPVGLPEHRPPEGPAGTARVRR